MKVHEAMTREVLTLRPDERLSDAAAKLAVSRLQVLPVVDEGGRLRGLLLERELSAAVRALSPENPEIPLPLLVRFLLPEQTVRDRMKPPTAKLRPEAPVQEAARTMLEHGVFGLPIVDDSDHLLGVFTVTDLLGTVAGGALTGTSD